MSEPPFALLEIVKLKHTRDLYDEGGPAGMPPLEAGALGTVCEMGRASCVACSVETQEWVFWVEFTDDAGKTIAVLPLAAEDLEKA